MKQILYSAIILGLLFIPSCVSVKQMPVGPKPGEKWRAIHLLNYTNDALLDSLSNKIPLLAEKGVNVIFLEVDYSFDFKSHPELRQGPSFITKSGAEKFSEVCRDNNIKLVIEFQCFGHQSWAKKTFPLLTVYPDLDLTKGAYPNNDSIYCREWDPYNLKVNKIVYSLIDELVDAFDVDGIHVGMDEVFLINDKFAASTKDKNPAEVYAKVVNDLYDHITKQRHLQMYMWGDRLIDGTKLNMGAWEASQNGTYPAIDLIPKDIIVCDWHYDLRDEYSSVPMFLSKGFRVLPTSWKNKEASNKLIEYSKQFNDPKMLGHLFSFWNGSIDSMMNSQAMNEGLKLLVKK
ncbi:MAG: family 20 glycosylhydrolase [Bacteroidota bacterium]|nr:family 20 glycosylhydrolase [Bacteroidota bacterium]